MVTLRVPTVLLGRTGGRRILEGSGRTLDLLLDDLSAENATLVDFIRPNGALTRFINIYVNGHEVRELIGLQTVLTPGDEVLVIPAVAGG
jgi:molybdopterin synthase sulfur carrier subunit